MSFASLARALAAPLLALDLAPPATAQTRPAGRELGIENPTSAPFVGNSFFCQDNSMHGHLGDMLDASTS